MSRWVHILIVEILRATDGAFLVLLDDDREVWIPRSQVDDHFAYGEGDRDITLSVTQWIANEKNLEEDGE